MRTAQAELRCDFGAGGDFTRVGRTATQSQTVRGTWKLDGASMELRIEGENDLLRFTVKMPDPSTLELWESADNGLRLIRQGAAPAGIASNAPTSQPASALANAANLPAGWSRFANPLVGIQAAVPKDYWVRLRGGTMLTVEKADSPATMSFVVPFKPRPGAKAADIADAFAKYIAQSEPRLKAQGVGQVSNDRAISHFTSYLSEKPVEGSYCTLIGAGGAMAYVIGVMAPQGQLEREMPTLRQVANGFGFVPPKGKWMKYQSPAGGFTMNLPQGWAVQTNDGQTPKDNIDWVAVDPQKPLSRAFQWCPRYCSPQLMQDPMHAMRGYQPAQFQNHQQVVVASLSQISQNVRLIKMNVNQPLTQLFRAMNQQTAQLLAALGAAQSDIIVYDCLAQAQVDGKDVVVAFVAGVQTLAINGGIMGAMLDLSVTLRGWCAEPDQFVNDSPVMERICASMELSAAFLNKITQGNEQAAGIIRSTYAKMNQIDNQIRDSRWNTMDAIAEMNYDNLRDYGGFVNETTGRIEQIPPDGLVKNSSGQYVSREEVDRGIPADSATVLRGAFSEDYMKGVYGRIEF
jgi:hypothetical protein